MKKSLVPILIAFLLSSCGKHVSAVSQESKEIIERSETPISSVIEDTSSDVISSSTEESSNTIISSVVEESSSDTISSSLKESSSEIISSSEAVSSSEQISSSEATASSSASEPVSVLKKTLTFYNGGFTGSLDLDNSRADFKDWCNQDVSIFDSINCEGYAQVNYIGNQGDVNRFSTLILGSQNKTGKLVFNLSVRAINVKITVQPYTKYIAFNDTYNVDTHALISINNEEHDLYLETGYNGPTENKNFEYLNIDGTKTISIANKEEGQRVFVHSMEITYWG